MKIAIFANDGKQSQNVKQRLEKRFTERHFVLDDKEPDVVISIGGDGTLYRRFITMKIVLTRFVLLAYTRVIWAFIQIGVMKKLMIL